MTRREAVQRLGYTAVGALAVDALGCAPRTSDAATAARPLGVQLYTVRDLMQEDVEGTLDRVAQIGYTEVEFAGYFGRTAAQIRDALRASGLSAPAAHVDPTALPDGWGRMLEDAATVGHQYVVVAWLPEERRRTLDDWKRMAELFTGLGRDAAAAGIQFGYHNHDFEFVAIDGQVPYDVLCEATDPKLVQLELDLYWITHAGGNPVSVFERWPGRIPMVHVKDRKADGTMTEVGSGTIDWPSLFAHRAQAGIKHYFVEYDRPADPLASIAASYAYLKGLDLS